MEFQELLQQILIDIMPAVQSLLVTVLTGLLGWLAIKANAWLQANASENMQVMLELIAKQIVQFIEQVGEMRGWASNSDKKEYAVNMLIKDMAALGYAITLEQADVAIEAAVYEFTSDVVEVIQGQI